MFGFIHGQCNSKDSHFELSGPRYFILHASDSFTKETWLGGCQEMDSLDSQARTFSGAAGGREGVDNGWASGMAGMGPWLAWCR